MTSKAPHHTPTCSSARTRGLAGGEIISCTPEPRINTPYTRIRSPMKYQIDNGCFPCDMNLPEKNIQYNEHHKDHPSPEDRPLIKGQMPFGRNFGTSIHKPYQLFLPERRRHETHRDRHNHADDPRP